MPITLGLALSCLLLASVSARGQAPPAPALTDLDEFMARVLQRRDENWRTLHEYVLDERERFLISGPGGVPLHGLTREYTWYVRDGYLVRSPVRFDGVTIAEGRRREYERNWLRKEQEREARRQRNAADAGAGDEDPESDSDDGAAATDVEGLVKQGGEPRFVSEAYFLRFKFEPGNYFLAGRESLDGRPVLRIEYYPSNLFSDNRRSGEISTSGVSVDREPRSRRRTNERPRDREQELEDKVESSLNKVALVTLWVDPELHQIVRFTFDNVGFGFLPLRHMMRLDDVRASMTMKQFFGGVWLPHELTMDAAVTLANGTYRFAYRREFSDYRQAEVKARIRGYAPKEP